jgi:hypothetical protein
VVQLADFGSHLRADYYVRRITRWGERRFTLLELPDGLTPPNDVRIWVLVEVLGPDTLRTLRASEFLRCLGEMESVGAEVTPLEQAVALFGPMPDQFSPQVQARLHSRLEADPNQDGPTYCLGCEAPVRPEDAFCTACGARRQAPPCPQCGQPLTHNKDGRRLYRTENGTYPWHLGWNGHCEQCGHHVAAHLRMATGHRALFRSPHLLKATIPTLTEGATGPSAGESIMNVEPGESVRVEQDAWDYQPTVEIRIRRALAATLTDAPGPLGEEERIVLTAEECRALMAQLQGPLAALLERREWSRDTT